MVVAMDPKKIIMLSNRVTGVQFDCHVCIYESGDR
jgi:hypothetical protein